MIKGKNSNHNQNLTDENLSSSIWVHVPLRNFGFKCMMAKHDLCDWTKCECLCHPHNQ